MLPKASIVIPTYNGEDFLEQAICSVLAQTEASWELILVDDGSTDNTLSIAEKYVSQYPKQIQITCQKHHGVSSARNRGIELSKAEIIGFLDQDDMYLPNQLQSQLTNLNQSEGIGYVNSGLQIVDEQNNILNTIQPWNKIPELTQENILVWKPVFLGAMIFRRHWLEKMGGFQAEYQQAGDVDLVLRLAVAECRAIWTKEITVSYRQHDNNTSRNAIQQTSELSKILDRFFSAENLPSHISELEKRSRYQSLIWSAWRLYRNGFSQDMATYLLESLQYSDRPRTQTLLDWIESFKKYEHEYGLRLDIQNLTELEEWNKLMETSILVM